MAGFTYTNFRDDLDVYMTHLKLAEGDTSFAILKAHLAIEQVMQDYLERRLPNPQHLKGLRLMYATTLALVRCVCLAPDNPIFETVKALNSLRNKLAHRLEPDQLAKETRLFIRDANSKWSIPFTETDDLLRDFEYTGAKVFGYFSAVLGLRPEFLKGADFNPASRLVGSDAVFDEPTRESGVIADDHSEAGRE